MTTTVQTIRLDRIAKDRRAQLRVKLDPHVIAEYAEAMRQGADFPPIVLFQDGDDYIIADGFHRVRAAQLARRAEIAAEVRPGTVRDAILHAAGANAEHGVRRTNNDKRRAIEALLDDPEWQRWSDAAIAHHCKVSPPTVAKRRSQYLVGGIYKLSEIDAAPLVRTAQRGGKRYEIDTTNIGRRPPPPGGIEPTHEELKVAFDAGREGASAPPRPEPTEAPAPAPEQAEDEDLTAGAARTVLRPVPSASDDASDGDHAGDETLGEIPVGASIELPPDTTTEAEALRVLRELIEYRRLDPVAVAAQAAEESPPLHEEDLVALHDWLGRVIEAIRERRRMGIRPIK